MHQVLRAVVLTCALLFSLTGHTDATSAPIVENTTVEKTQAAMFSQDEVAFFRRSINVIGTFCAAVYPAPNSELECYTKINAKLYGVFPQAYEKAKAAGILPPVTVGNAEAFELMTGIASILAECRGNDFAACTDKALHIAVSAFDPHSAYFNAEEAKAFSESMSGSFFGIGIVFEGFMETSDPLIVAETRDGSPAQKAGVLVGDRIVAIDGNPVEKFATTNTVISALRGPRGTVVKLTIERNGKILAAPIEITRDKIEMMTVKGTLLRSAGNFYGLVSVSQFDRGVCSRIEKEYKKLDKDSGGKLKGLILSFESDPGGALDEAHCVLDLFMDAPSFVLSRDRNGIEPYAPPVHPLTRRSSVPSFPGDITKGLPILVMIDGASASASEIVARGLQHAKRAVVAGTNSFTKGSVQTIIPIDDVMIKVTVAEYLVGTMTDWVPVQCIGVTPDILFDRGFDPKDENGNPRKECGLAGSIASGGPMQNAPVRTPFTASELARANALLDVYKKHLTDSGIDEKRRTQMERLKKLQESKKKTQ